MRFLDLAKLRMEGSVEDAPIMDFIAQNHKLDEVALGTFFEENKGRGPGMQLVPIAEIHALPKDASVADEDSDVDSETDAFGITPHPLATKMWKDRLQELANEGRTYTTEDRFDHIMKWRSKNWPKYMKEMEKFKNWLDEKDVGNRRKAPKRGLQEIGDSSSSSSSSSSALPSASSSDQPN